MYMLGGSKLSLTLTSREGREKEIIAVTFFFFITEKHLDAVVIVVNTEWIQPEWMEE